MSLFSPLNFQPHNFHDAHAHTHSQYYGMKKFYEVFVETRREHGVDTTVTFYVVAPCYDLTLCGHTVSRLSGLFGYSD